MRNQSKSIFGKILGSGASNDEDLYDEEEDVEQEELADEEEFSEDTASVDVEYDEEAEAVAVPATTAQSGPEEEWLSENEGSLNIDMYQTRDNVIIKSTIAGVKPEDVDITVANDIVTIRGLRKRDEQILDEDYFYQECYWGSFTRSVIVPVDIDSEHIEADLKDGILTVIVPKAAKAKTRKVKVRGM